MYKKVIFIISLITVTAFINGCEEKSDPAFDQENFTKIYDTNQFSALFNPIDIKQTSDGGYLILAERKLDDSEYSGIYLMKTDQYGNFVNGVEVDETYVNPVGELISSGTNYYFFCMEGLSTRLASTDKDLSSVEFSTLSEDLSYPAASSLDDATLLLLSYDNTNRQTVVSKVTQEGNVVTSQRFDIEAEDQIEEPIIKHFTRAGRKFPMQIGRTSSGYYFNGFVSYNFSLVFTSLGDDNAYTKIVYGQRDDGGISAIVPVSATEFAAARFNFGDNYFLPKVSFDQAQISSADLEGNPLLELAPNAKVKILRATISGKNVLVFASPTKSKQIGLFFYDETSGNFIGSRYLGYTYPYEVSSLIQTVDNGLAICGTTYLVGRFPRICLFKLSEDELAKGLNF